MDPDVIDAAMKESTPTDKAPPATALATVVDRPERRRHRVGVQRAEVGHHGEGDRREGADEGPALTALERREQPGEQADRGEHRTGPTDGRGVLGVDQEEQDDRQPGRDDTGLDREGARLVPDVAVGLQRDEHRPVGEEEGDEGEPAEQRDRPQQAEQGAVEDVVPSDLRVDLDRAAPDDIRQADAPEQGGGIRPAGDAPVPPLPPQRGVPLAPVVQPHAAQDQRDEDEREGEVVAGEKRGVPLWEGREGGATRGEHPDLVAVPDRADGVDEDAPTPVRLLRGAPLAKDRQEHADAEVEAFEGEIADPQDGDEGEPDDLQG